MESVMEFSIMDPSGNVVATASDACEARDKFRRGGCVFGNQTIVDPSGAKISEADLEALCAREEAAAETSTA
jgi:hypothetical protein